MTRSITHLMALVSWLASTLVQAQTLSAPSQQPLIEFRDHLINGQPCTACPQMTAIPTGSFKLGSSPHQRGHNDERGPSGQPLRVKLATSLAFSSGEITRREFSAFIAANPELEDTGPCAGLKDEAFVRDAGPSWRDPGFEQGDDHPVVCINWRTASAYAAWLSKITGRHYRLPSEAEWEYAARAGSSSSFWWGDRIMHNQVNCRSPVCDRTYRETAPVGALAANPFGLRHMLGNAWEWTADCYDAQAYLRTDISYPSALGGPPDCRRVIRGGSWQENPWSLRASNREAWRPDIPLNDIGFRVVREGADFPI